MQRGRVTTDEVWTKSISEPAYTAHNHNLFVHPYVDQGHDLAGTRSCSHCCLGRTLFVHEQEYSCSIVRRRLKPLMPSMGRLHGRAPEGKSRARSPTGFFAEPVLCAVNSACSESARKCLGLQPWLSEAQFPAYGRSDVAPVSCCVR